MKTLESLLEAEANISQYFYRQKYVCDEYYTNAYIWRKLLSNSEGTTIGENLFHNLHQALVIYV